MAAHVKPTRRLRLSAEIACHPTRLEHAGTAENVAPSDLPVSPALASALNEWADRWDAIYDLADPASAAFPSEAEEQRFHRDAETLSARLRAELGPEWAVDLRL
jgi:hypothetical protein